ncbi:hypothetical protein CVV38_04180 [Candidatus Peregrinibacteria bacterium HGW-Peregrinibacteria-1]|jgi:small basic protein|nr:MAG: hypothetical protein CVV38_04180 [Candidatus Peregrinibacteria bacterium HGW-Peregrinibacteria-1]
MVWIIIGISIGVIIGSNTAFTFPQVYIQYSAVVIIAIIDFLTSTLKAEIKKIPHSPSILFTNLAYNVCFALLITYVGSKLGIDLYLAVAIFFIFHIFNNINELRKYLFKKNQKDHSKESISIID